MFSILDDEIQALGATTVIVVLKTTGTPNADAAAARSVDPNDLKKHFSRDASSQGAALAAELRSGSARVPPPPAMRYYPNLGVMLGTVDKQGLAGLRGDKKRVTDVCAAPRFIFRSCTPPPGVTRARGNRGFPNAVRALSFL